MTIENNLNQVFFTEYDKRITGTAQRDPLGLQPIWSYFGRKVVCHLTTVSSHIHGFREVLLCLSICHQVYQTQTKYSFADLILLFEQLFIYTAIEKKNDGKLSENKGILGADNGNVRFRSSNGNPEINAENTILVREISLGYYGRYKTPLTTMLVIDKKNQLKIDEESVKSLYGIDCYNSILFSFQQFLSKKRMKLNNFDARNELFEAVLGKFRPGEKDFWLEKLQVKGSTKSAIMEECYNKIDCKNDDKQSYQEIIELLTKREEVENILKLEPFLRCLEEVFYESLKSKDLKSIQVEDSGKHIERYESFNQIIGGIDLQQQSLLTERFKYLKQKCSPMLDSYVKSVIDYHIEVCKQKKSAYWLEIDSQDNIQTFISVDDSVDISAWGRDYYLSSLRSVKQEILEFSNGKN